MTTSFKIDILEKPDVKLIGQRLLGKPVLNHHRLGRGRNSRCYQLECADGKTYALKFYFQSPHDCRDRLEVEFKALSFLRNHGIRSIPKAIVMDSGSQAAIYQYITGDPIKKNLNTTDINQLIEFLKEMNQLRRTPEALKLGPASEACFSIAEIMNSIENRLTRFNQVVLLEKALEDFLNLEFQPLWAKVQQWISQANIDLRQQLPKEQRILSPSDFGFHNAFKKPEGDIVFLDFEYFGWDDPAKLICDFILHPGMSLSDHLKTFYVEKVLQLFPEQKNLRERTALVYPLSGLKWTLILLNEFICDDIQRRHFASQGTYELTTIQKQQLKKAKKMHQKIKSTYQRCPFL